VESLHVHIAFARLMGQVMLNCHYDDVCIIERQSKQAGVILDLAGRDV
jgi:hypothetical protein